MTNIEQTIERQKINIGMLRQWLNEDRITEPNKMVTNEMLEGWLKTQNTIKQILEVLVEDRKNKRMKWIGGEAELFIQIADGYNQANTEFIKELEEAIALLDKKELQNEKIFEKTVVVY